MFELSSYHLIHQIWIPLKKPSRRSRPSSVVIEPSYISKRQFLLALFSGICPHLPDVQTVTSKRTRSRIAYLLDTWSLLYKPGLLTFPFFLAFLSTFIHPFHEKKISKYQKVTPKVNEWQKVTYSPRGKVVIKALKNTPNNKKQQFHMKKKLSKLSKHQKEAPKLDKVGERWQKVDISNRENSSNTQMGIINGIKIVQAIKSKFQGGRRKCNWKMSVEWHLSWKDLYTA